MNVGRHHRGKGSRQMRWKGFEQITGQQAKASRKRWTLMKKPSVPPPPKPRRFKLTGLNSAPL